MAIISSIDGALRRIYLHSDTIGDTIHPIDIYKEMRTFRKDDESLRGYDVFLKAFGNQPKGAGKFTERYVQCVDGTRIVPFDTSQELTISGTIITDDGQEGIACFDRSTLDSNTVVDINYVPPQVEIITVSTGSGLDSGQDSKLTNIDNIVAQIRALTDELHKIQGLDESVPMVVTPDQRTAGTIKLDITGDGINISTVQRND